ncbi:MAG: DNA polymerase II large subunit, partial [Candidatus Bathyarchaeota archaeon]|nr:DNA polymerase II large subunit [Candidatus Bathyarchaeota archaeon]
MNIVTTDACRQYLIEIEQKLNVLYDIASEARKKGLDPTFTPEPRVVRDLGEMVENLVGPPNIAERVRELSKQMDVHELAFVVASEIVLARFGQTDPEEAAEQAIRTSLAIMTGGITAAPVQGIARVRIKSNADRTNHLAIYYAGPIRSAAGTEQALTLVLGEFVRRKLGLDRYRAGTDEIRRFIEEIRLYEREVRRFQYHNSDEELSNSLRNLPIECTGTETDPFEVSSFRNLPRIDTNRLRGGALLVLNDGIVGRAQKVQGIIDKLGLEGWDWLKQVKETPPEKNAEGKFNSKYLDDVIGGRPVFSLPSAKGGFRLRYGRSRNTGLAALGVHPATMAVLDNFLASGTQMRVEGPGKGGIVLPVDTLEPPVVKLRDGAVVRVETESVAKQLTKDIDEVLFLGDLLVAFGEFLENNKALYPSGYTEEWWSLDVRARISEICADSIANAAKKTDIPVARMAELLDSPLSTRVQLSEALTITKQLDVPLHPRYTYFWNNLELHEFNALRRVLTGSERNVSNGVLKGLRIPHDKGIKAILEKVCIPHSMEGTTICLGEDAIILAACLNLDEPSYNLDAGISIVKAITTHSGIRLRDKGATYIGARMGRPEKAKKRQMSPLVHVLFPVGLAGGPRRNIAEAAKKDQIEIELVSRTCPDCSGTTHRVFCPRCGAQTEKEKICPRCKRQMTANVCPACNVPPISYNRRMFRIQEEFRSACHSLGQVPPTLIKGVRGLTSITKTPEPLQKGILRAKHGLSVFKDGTIRFDATNAPLTHIKPAEIGVPVEDLRRLGYVHDIVGRPLRDSTQMCELKVQDVVIPRGCAQYLVKETAFIDDLLMKVYDLPTYYNVKTDRDLVGHLIIGFAPHTSAGVIGRIIGFTDMHVCYAHPLWHNIKRRDCDGDEDAIMLVLDVLLNFSKAFLPSRIGGLMDAPLLLISFVNPFEADEVHNLDVARFYPLEFYEKTLERVDPSTMSALVDIVQHRLGTPAQYEGYAFTHETYDLNEGNQVSSYMGLGSMQDKINGQLQLAEKIRAVDSSEVARRV